MSEQIILDPAEITQATSRTELDITPWVKQDGPDWGDAAITSFMADAQRGQVQVDFDYPQREIGIPLVLKNVGGTSTSTIRSSLQAKLALIQQEGGIIKRVMNNGGTLYAELTGGTGRFGSLAGYEVTADIETSGRLDLEAIPDFFGPSILESNHTETSLTEITWTETGITGNYPARVQIAITEGQGQNQLGLMFAVRCRNYSSASTAKSFYEAETLTPLDTAAAASLSGASGGTVVTHSSLSTNWTPVLGSNISGSYMTHTGTYQLWARVYSTSGTAVMLRSVSDVGDLTAPTENDLIQIPGASNFYMLDLGEHRLTPAPVGTHRWQFQIQARGVVGGENVSIDKIWLASTDEAYGVLSAPIDPGFGLSSYSVRDEFNQTAGTLTGKTLPVGGTWASGGGGTADFSMDTVLHTVQRFSATPRILVANGSSYSRIVVRVDFKMTDAPGSVSGVIARQVDSNNYVNGFISGSSALPLAQVVKTVGGVNSIIASARLPAVQNSAWYSCLAFIDSDGRVLFQFGPRGGVLTTQITGLDSALATGGTLASGKVGIYDSSDARTDYDNFAAWVPVSDAVMFANRICNISTDGHYRQDTSGSAYGPVTKSVGRLPRLPAAGLEGRTCEIMVKASRGDFDQLPDTAIDDLSARATFWPSYLTTP